MTAGGSPALLFRSAVLFVPLTLPSLGSACQPRYVRGAGLQPVPTPLAAGAGKRGQTHRNAGLTRRCLGGCGACAVMCSLRRHLPLGGRASLLELCNNQRTPPAPGALGTGAASPAAAPLPRSPSPHGRAGAPEGLGPGPRCGERSRRNPSPAPGELPPAGAPSPPLLLSRRQRPAPLSALFLEIRRIGWGKASHRAAEERLAVPAAAKLPLPGAKRKPLHDRKVK